MAFSLKKELDRIDLCCEAVHKYTHTAKAPGQKQICGAHVFIPITCDSPWCRRCRPIRDRKLARDVEKIIRAMDRPTQLSLTLTNSDDLPGMMDKMSKCYSKLIRNKLWKEYVKGGIWGRGLTISYDPSSGLYHYHLHFVVDTYRFFPWQLLKAEWLRISGSKMIGTPKRVISPRAQAREIIQGTRKGGKADWDRLLDVFDSDENGLEVRKEVMAAFHGKRMFQTFGSVRSNISKPERTPTVCPRCGKKFVYVEWIVETVWMSDLKREMHNGSAGSLLYFNGFGGTSAWRPPPDNVVYSAG